MPPKRGRGSPKRASSADRAAPTKRTKTTNDGSTVEVDLGSSRRPARSSNAKREASADAADARKKKPKLSVNDVDEELSKITTLEDRPALGEKRLTQAIPDGSLAADNDRAGQDPAVKHKASSWAAFKKVALKLKEAGHDSVKIEIDNSTSLTKFFPRLPSGIFESVPFRNCALEYRFEATKDQPATDSTPAIKGQPAGASLIAEVTLAGPLEEAGRVFSKVLGQKEAVLRVAGFLGVVLEEDKDVAIDSLTLVGCFLGCNIAYPADSNLVQITSLGATISVTKKGEAALLDVAKAAVLPSAVSEQLGSSLALQEAILEGTGPSPISLDANLVNATPAVAVDLAKLEAAAKDVAAGENIKEADEEEEEEEKEEDEEEDENEEEEEEEDDDDDEGDVSRHVNYSLFGTVDLPVSGQALPLSLDLDLSVVEDFMIFTMSPKGAEKKWNDVFGFESFDLNNVLFQVGYPLGSGQDEEEKGEKEDPEEDEEEEGKGKAKEFQDLMKKFKVENGDEDDTQPFVALQAGWKTSIGDVVILGKITRDWVSSSIKGTVRDVSFAKIKTLFEQTHKISLGETDINIRADELTIELSKEGLRLEGALTIYGQEVNAKILLSAEGVSLTASTPRWEVDDEGTLTIEDAQVSFFVGKTTKDPDDKSTAEKAVINSVGWFGGFSVKGTFTFNQDLKITVTLQIIRKTGGGWGYIVTGEVESELSLADLVSYVKHGDQMDISLKKVWLVAANINVTPAMLPPSAHGFPVKKGLFLCAYLDTVPLIEGPSGIVKKADPKDLAYLYLGVSPGPKLSVEIYLPPSMTIDLGTRAKVGDFRIEVSGTKKGPEVAFYGHVIITLEATRKLDFELMLQGNAIGGKLSIVMDGIIKDPFGLSERIVLGAEGEGQKLGFQVEVTWIQFLATGLPSGLGLSGSIHIDYGTDNQKTYGMLVNLSENPLDLIIIVNATSLSYTDLVDIASALTGTQIPAADVGGATFKNIEVYASAGGSFGSVSYPPGFRMRGIMSINGKEAYFMCDISTSGLRLLACVPSFELGPLILTGEKDLPDLKDWPAAMQEVSKKKLEEGVADQKALALSTSYKGKYAMLDLEIALAKQSFILNGKIEIFGIQAYADILCQYKPDPKFSFDFSLQWNELFRIVLHAKMIQGGDLNRPRDSDFEVFCLFEQNSIAHLVDILTKVLNTVSDTISVGVNKAKAGVEAAAQAKREACERAIKALRLAKDDLDIEKASIEASIAANKQKKADREQEYKKRKAEAEAERLRKIRESGERRAREKQEAKDKKDRETAEANARAADAAQRKRDKEAAREQQKRDMQSRFGGISKEDIVRFACDQMNAARGNRNYWDRRVDEINGFYHPVDEADARASLVAATIAVGATEAAFWALENLTNSGAFDAACRALHDIENQFGELADKLNNVMEEVGDFVHRAGEELRSKIHDIDQACNDMLVEAESLVRSAGIEIDNVISEIDEVLTGLYSDLQKVLNGVKAKVVEEAERLAEAAKNDTTLEAAAMKVLNGFDNAQRAAAESLNELVKDFAGKLVDINHVSLAGTLRSDAKQQTPFVITIKGEIFGKQSFQFDLEWTPWRPGADDTAFFTRLSGVVMAWLRNDTAAMIKASKAVHEPNVITG